MMLIRWQGTMNRESFRREAVQFIAATEKDHNMERDLESHSLGRKTYSLIFRK